MTRVIATLRSPPAEMDIVENDEGGSILLVSRSGLVNGRVSQVVTSLSPDQARAAARILLSLSSPQGDHANGLRPICDLVTTVLTDAGIDPELVGVSGGAR